MRNCARSSLFLLEKAERLARPREAVARGKSCVRSLFSRPNRTGRISAGMREV